MECRRWHATFAEARKRSVPKNNAIFKADRGTFGLLSNLEIKYSLFVRATCKFITSLAMRDNLAIYSVKYFRSVSQLINNGV